MKKNKQNDSYKTLPTSKTISNTDDIDFIDPVAPKDQLEEQDPFFKQMGDSQNTKFVEQKVDDDEPVGSLNGEYKHDDENSDENPSKDSILHEIRTKQDRAIS